MTSSAPAGASTAEVSVRDVRKVYETREGPLEALAGISMDIRSGEFVSFVGPSGCGKSTLLLMIAGLIPITSGRISINGALVERPQTDLGIVFQDPVLLEWRNVLKNLMIQVELRKLDKKVHLQRAAELLNLVGLGGFERKYPYELSGGMRQRVSICRALLHDPQLLLMDEPFGALDALTRDQLNLDLQRIWMQSRKTVIFVTHSISEAVLLSDRVFVITPRPGRLEEVIPIDLPRPRHLSARETSEFGRYTKHVRRLFESYGVIRDIEDGATPLSGRPG